MEGGERVSSVRNTGRSPTSPSGGGKMEFPDDFRSDEWMQRYEKMVANKVALEMKLGNNPSPDRERALRFHLVRVEKAIEKFRSRLDSPYFVR